MNWSNYFFGVDFTPEVDLIGTLPTGPIAQEDSIPLIAILNEKDSKEGKGCWCFEDEIRSFNLKQVDVIYNGANSTDLPTHPLYENVAILEFSQESEAPVGRIYLHYN